MEKTKLLNNKLGSFSSHRPCQTAIYDDTGTMVGWYIHVIQNIYTCIDIAWEVNTSQNILGRFLLTKIHFKLLLWSNLCLYVTGSKLNVPAKLVNVKRQVKFHSQHWLMLYGTLYTNDRLFV